MFAAFPYGLLGFLPAIGLFWRIFRKSGADRVVVWLRRFHRHEPSRFPLPKYFSIVGVFRFQVATIQESRFRYSILTGATKSGLTLIGSVILLTLPSFVIAWVVVDRILDWLRPERVPGGTWELLAILLMTLVVNFAILGPFAYLLTRKRGVVRLRDVGDLARIKNWIGRIHAGIGPIWPGLKIFKCGDDFWMDAVRLMLDRCDAAIVDISDLNENMRWELGQCAEQIRSDKLILAYSVPPDRYPDDPSDALVQEIEELIGEAKLREVCFWPYPEPLTLSKGKAVVDEDLELEVLTNLESALDFALEGAS